MWYVVCDEHLPNELLALRHLLLPLQLRDVTLVLLAILGVIQLIHVISKQLAKLRVLEGFLESRRLCLAELHLVGVLGLRCFEESFQRVLVHLGHGLWFGRSSAGVRAGDCKGRTGLRGWLRGCE
jgi:hypothetical protein